jgi:hypothetical protein
MDTAMPVRVWKGIGYQQIVVFGVNAATRVVAFPVAASSNTARVAPVAEDTKMPTSAEGFFATFCAIEPLMTLR